MNNREVRSGWVTIQCPNCGHKDKFWNRDIDSPSHAEWCEKCEDAYCEVIEKEKEIDGTKHTHCPNNS